MKTFLIMCTVCIYVLVTVHFTDLNDEIVNTFKVKIITGTPLVTHIIHIYQNIVQLIRFYLIYHIKSNYLICI